MDWIPSPSFPFWKSIFSLEAFPCAEFPPGLTRLMSPLCNSGLSRSNSPDLNKAATAENSSKATVSHTQAALHVEGFWMCPKSNQWMLFIFLPNAGCITLQNMDSMCQGTLRKLIQNKKTKLIWMLVIYTHQWPEAIWDTKGYHVISQQNWLNFLRRWSHSILILNQIVSCRAFFSVWYLGYMSIMGQAPSFLSRTRLWIQPKNKTGIQCCAQCLQN